MDKRKRQKNMIIGGLLAIVLVMAVGYAAFATQLNINGTSTISTSWDVEITNIEVLAKSSGASDNEGSPTYNNTNGLTASFNTNLTSPGDYATYKIEVTNKGSLNAVLSSITEPVNNNVDIKFYLNKNQNNQDITDTDRMIGTNDILNATGDSNNLDKGYVYVTVVYEDREGQTSPTGDAATATATVTLNFSQSNEEATASGSGGGTPNSRPDASIAYAAANENNKGIIGTCNWWIDEDGCYNLAPINGISGVASEYRTYNEGTDRETSQWYSQNLVLKGIEDKITSVYVYPGVSVKGSTSNMLGPFPNALTMDLTNLDTSEVTDMSAMFSDDSSLTNIILSSDFDTSNVINMSRMFSDCQNLVLDASNWNVSNVRYTEYNKDGAIFGTGGHESFNENAPGVIAPEWVND